MEVAEERVTLRELIRRRIDQEVAEFKSVPFGCPGGVRAHVDALARGHLIALVRYAVRALPASPPASAPATRCRSSL